MSKEFLCGLCWLNRFQVDRVIGQEFCIVCLEAVE
jgi:hypothetical protein